MLFEAPESRKKGISDRVLISAVRSIEAMSTVSVSRKLSPELCSAQSGLFAAQSGSSP
jgi:hypothetical protein